MAHVVAPPMPAVDGPGLAPVQQREGMVVRGRIEQEADIVLQGGLVLLNQEDIVAAGIKHLLTKVKIAESAYVTLAARRGSGRRANAAARLRGDTASGTGAGGALWTHWPPMYTAWHSPW